jgi:dynein heavy chain
VALRLTISGEPKSFWLGAFTFPTGFLTAVLQKAARKNNVPVDALSFEFNIASSDGEALSPAIAKEGVFIHGLYLEGAG